MRNFQMNHPAALLVPAALVLAAGLPAQTADVDNRIEASAKNSYNFKTFLKDDNIKIESANGVVTLTGTVSRDYHKALAEETISGLPGVKSVNNQLALAGIQPTENSDDWITLKAMAALLFHKNVSATGTDVHTEDGIVTITGNADSLAQKDLTTEYIKDVEGVKEVRNEMIITRSLPLQLAQDTLMQNVDDPSITAQIRTSLRFRKSTQALAAKVITRDGVVTLSGEVKNDAERELVAKLAEDIKGVKRVDNRLTVPKS